MQELIKISADREGRQAVSARDLYTGLGLEPAHYSRWSKKNITNNPYAKEGEDWEGFTMMVNGNESKDFTLTLDFAKRLAMMARTEQGEKIRFYFIACEQRALLNNRQTLPYETASHVLQALAQINIALGDLTCHVVRLEEQQKKAAPRTLHATPVQFAYNQYTIEGFGILMDLQIPFHDVWDLRTQAVSLSKEMGFPVRTETTQNYGTIWKFNAKVLCKLFNLQTLA